MQEQAMRRPHLKALTGVRIVAALLVVTYHAVRIQQPPASSVGAAFALLANDIFSSGFIGVPLFFILSGFILTYNYSDEAGGLRVAPRAFWVARFARIYPAYLVGFLLATGLYVWTHHASLLKRAVTAALTLTLTQSWIPRAAMAWNPPGWTLSVEAFFYALFPLLLLCLLRRPRRHIYAFVGLSWVALLAVAVGCAMLASRMTGAHAAIVTTLNSLVAVNPLIRLPEFMIGMALGQLYLRGRVTSRPAPRWGTVTALAALVLVAALSLGAALLPGALTADVLLDPVLALLVYSLAWQQGRVAAALSRPTMVLLGEASYAVYIVHVPILWWMTHLVNHPGVVFTGAYLALVLGFSIATLVLIEQPARRAIVRMLRGIDRQAYTPQAAEA